MNNLGLLINDGPDVDENVPKAYLNYILFDENFVPYDFGFDQVSTAARETFTCGNPDDGLPPGSPCPHEKLELTALAQVRGYIYIYLSNESNAITDVYFDDLKINHTGAYVSQATDYGVWGDVLREQKSEHNDMYRWYYQGQFAERDLETGWSHFELREYDPVIGRWHSPDAYRQFWSPYLGMANNPIFAIDSDGGYSKFGATWRSWLTPGSQVVPIGSEYGLYNQGKINDYTYSGDVVTEDQGNELWVQLGHKFLYSEIWNSLPARMAIPDVITLDITGSSTFFVAGEGVTYTLNIVTRGEDFGIHKTTTVIGPNRFGLEFDGGINIGRIYSTLKDPRQFKIDHLLGRTHSISAGFGAGVNGVWGTDGKGTVLTVGASTGFGVTAGASYGRGQTLRGWGMSNYVPEDHFFLED